MARKRKQTTNPTQQPTKKQQQHKQKQQIEEVPEPEEDVEEVDEEVYEDVEDEEEDDDDDEEEEEDEDEDENDGGEDEENRNQISADQNENDDDPVEKLLEPFPKEQLVALLREAADKHPDIADRVRTVADEDPVHRKIFVHGLGWDTTTESLANAFKPYGEIEDCKAVTDKISGKSKGYGFILFKRRSGARRALREPQKKIGSRMTACQLAAVGPVPSPSVSAPATTPPASEYTQRKIYVSNVSAELDPQRLVGFFSKFGEIEEGPLGLDKVTGKPKGFCLFVYRSAESARKVLEEPHKNFEGHILHCQKAIDGLKPGKSQHQLRHHNVPRNDNGGGGGYGAGSSVAGPGHLMAPAGGPRMGFNQGAAAAATAAAPGLNPAIGQALTALLATQGAGLGLGNLLGTLGSTGAVNQAGVPGAASMQGAYGNQANISPGMIGGYGNQGVMQGGYPNQQVGQGGSGRGQHGGQYGGVAPYMGGQ